MAYSNGSTPLPPPPTMSPSSYGAAYSLHNNTMAHPAQGGIAPVNQMSNQFGGRQGGNPMLSQVPTISGGNRTSQHVVTAGNNNVSYATPDLLKSNQSLWQTAQQQSVNPANGMSFGFMKNTANSAVPGGPTAPVVPPPPPVAPGGPTYNPMVDPQPDAQAKHAAEVADRDAAAAAAAHAAANRAAGGGAQTGTFGATAKPTMTAAAARAAFEKAHPGVARTYKAPDGTLRYTSQWGSYLSGITVKG